MQSRKYSRMLLHAEQKDLSYPILKDPDKLVRSLLCTASKRKLSTTFSAENVKTKNLEKMWLLFSSNYSKLRVNTRRCFELVIVGWLELDSLICSNSMILLCLACFNRIVLWWKLVNFCFFENCVAILNPLYTLVRLFIIASFPIRNGKKLNSSN